MRIYNKTKIIRMTIIAPVEERRKVIDKLCNEGFHIIRQGPKYVGNGKYDPKKIKWVVEKKEEEPEKSQKENEHLKIILRNIQAGAVTTYWVETYIKKILGIKNTWDPTPVKQDRGDGQWYFWDETWTTRYGPYNSEEEAKKACTEYCKKVLGE